MLRTAGWLALPRRTWSAGFDGRISPSFQFVAAQLLGGWDLTEARLSLASLTQLVWTHNSPALRQGAMARCWSLPRSTHPPVVPQGGKRLACGKAGVKGDWYPDDRDAAG